MLTEAVICRKRYDLKKSVKRILSFKSHRCLTITYYDQTRLSINRWEIMCKKITYFPYAPCTRTVCPLYAIEFQMRALGWQMESTLRCGSCSARCSKNRHSSPQYCCRKSAASRRLLSRNIPWNSMAKLAALWMITKITYWKISSLMTTKN